MILNIYNSVYESSGPNKISWSLSGRVMSCSTDKSEYSVKVLAEELAYNKSLKQFKMFIVDKPLDPHYKVDANPEMFSWMRCWPSC